jgi:hypothetical protein
VRRRKEKERRKEKGGGEGYHHTTDLYKLFKADALRATRKVQAASEEENVADGQQRARAVAILACSSSQMKRGVPQPCSAI